MSCDVRSFWRLKDGIPSSITKPAGFMRGLSREHRQKNVGKVSLHRLRPLDDRMSHFYLIEYAADEGKKTDALPHCLNANEEQ